MVMFIVQIKKPPGNQVQSVKVKKKRKENRNKILVVDQELLHQLQNLNHQTEEIIKIEQEYV
jgi:hypothetical protein